MTSKKCMTNDPVNLHFSGSILIMLHEMIQMISPCAGLCFCFYLCLISSGTVLSNY